MKKRISPIFYEIEKLKKQYPHMKLADIAKELTKLGFRKSNGNEYNMADVSHLYKRNLIKANQMEMIKELQRLRGKKNG